MSLNYKEIDCILDELSLSGSFIQNIVQPSYDTIAFYTYGTKSRVVLVCLAPGVCRLHETRAKVPKNDKPLRFMEFLRSRIKGSRIDEIVQLNNDRIIRLSLSHGAESFFIYIRLWSGAANIVVTDPEHTILDVFYRRPKRGEVSGGKWEIPEPKKAAGETGKEKPLYTVRDLPGELPFNERIELWYAEHAQTLSREALIEEARKRYGSRRVRLEAALVKLEKKRDSFLDADRFRHLGDLVIANLYAIKPGTASIEVVDYENNDALLNICLDPHLKGQENAALYYENYKKAVSGIGELEDDIASSRAMLVTLASELEAIEAESNPLVIRQILRKQNKPKQQLAKRYPGLAFRKDGWIMLVGRTAAENDELLRRHVKGSDLWLHTRDWPGGYVFVKNRAGKSIPLEILLDAGTLALFYSKGRKAGSADLYYTQVKHLRRAKNAPKGTVLPSNEKNLTIKLDDSRLKILETCQDQE